MSRKGRLSLLVTYLVFVGYALIEAESYLSESDVVVLSIFVVGFTVIVAAAWFWWDWKVRCDTRYSIKKATNHSRRLP